MEKRTVLSWRAVSRSFGPTRALDRLDLDVAAGEVFGFLGPNGAGKSTAIRIAVGLLAAESGEVRLNGIPSTNPESRRNIGYLPEDLAFPHGFRLAEWLRHQVRLRSGDPSRIPAAAERVRLSERLESDLNGFSKGMRRRAALALLLVLRPEVWLLDEPTADLDVEGREMVEDIILEARAGGATFFISSHILSEVERVCDRVGLIERGTLTRTATPAELLPEPFLIDLTLPSLPDDLAPFVEGRRHLVSRAASRLRVFVKDREEGDRVIQLLEEGGMNPSMSLFRAASLRDSIREMLQ